MPHPPISPSVGPHTRPHAHRQHPFPGTHRSSGARAAATAWATALLLALAADPAGAQRSGLERSGPLGGDVRRAPSDTLWRLERLERELPAATSIERGRADWELEELRRDAARAERAARGRSPAGPGSGLLEAERSDFPDRRSLSDPAPVFGTAKEWMRVEGLLGAAETSFRRGERDRARFLAEQARAGLAAARNRLPADDPQVRAAEARLGALRAGLGG